MPEKYSDARNREGGMARSASAEPQTRAQQERQTVSSGGGGDIKDDPAIKQKAWEEWLTEQKSNTERSIHGNAGREPNSGVNTNTGFDAPKDYEGFSHSGVRPEQFKHERKKPKVTTKERISIGETYPSKAGQGTGDGGNPYNTITNNKDDKGRARGGKDRR